MERILQWLDDVDDLLGAVGLLTERLRHFAVALLRLIALFSVTACGIVAALTKPPLGLAVAILLFVFLLYRGVTRPGLAVRSRGAPA